MSHPDEKAELAREFRVTRQAVDEALSGPYARTSERVPCLVEC
jgi:hypothetical protein